MKTNRTDSMKFNPLTTALALASIGTALLVGAPSRAAAAKPYVYHIDAKYEDTLPCGTPVEIHVTSIIIFRPGVGAYALLQSTSVDWTNLQTGRTVTTVGAGNFTLSFTGDFPDTSRGVILIEHAPGVFVDAGLVEIAFTYDPVTDTYFEVTVKSVGTHPGDFNDVL